MKRRLETSVDDRGLLDFLVLLEVLEFVFVDRYQAHWGSIAPSHGFFLHWDLLEETEIRFVEDIHLCTDEERELELEGGFGFVIAVDLLVRCQPEARPSFRTW